VTRVQRWRASAGAVLTAGLIALVPATDASAHAEVVSTSPTAGSSIGHAPDTISVTFSEAVDLVPRALTLTTDLGVPVALRQPRLVHGGQILVAAVADDLASGGYRVGWRALADDGHVEGGSFGFTLAVGAGGASAVTRPSQTATPPASPGEPIWPVAVAAALAVAALAGAAVVVRRGLGALEAPLHPFGEPEPRKSDRASHSGHRASILRH
jgi:methionine-rich copper-binding protein CopC